MKNLKKLSVAFVLALLAAGGLAVSQQPGPGPSNFILTLTDGVNTVFNFANALKVTVTGCTVGGTTPNATLNCAGAGATGAGVSAGQSPLGMGDNNTALAPGHFVYFTNVPFTGAHSKPLPDSVTQGAGFIILYDKQRTVGLTNTLTFCAAGTDTVDGGGAGSCTAAMGVAGGTLLLQNDGAGKWSTIVQNTLGLATPSVAGIAKLHNVPVSLGWIATVNPNNAVVAVINQASTISAIIGTVETATGSAATVTVNKAPSGTACPSGTALHSGTFNANGTAATNQNLTVTTASLAAGDRICLQTTGTTSWTGGTGVGTITVFLAPS